MGWLLILNLLVLCSLLEIEWCWFPGVPHIRRLLTRCYEMLCGYEFPLSGPICQVAFDCILMPHHDSLAHSQSTMCRAFAECAPATPMKLPFAKVHEQWLGWHYYQGICRPGFALWGPWPSWPKPRSPSQGKTSRIMPVDLIKQSDFSSSTSVAPSSLVQLQRPLCPNFCIYSK